jgi:hypothetical protein
MKPTSLQNGIEQALQTDLPSKSSSESGIRPRVSLEALERTPAERATVVFRGMFPMEDLIHFIRGHARLRIGQQDLRVLVEAPQPRSWKVSMQVAGGEVVGRASDPFAATLHAFELLA